MPLNKHLESQCLSHSKYPVIAKYPEITVLLLLSFGFLFSAIGFSGEAIRLTEPGKSLTLDAGSTSPFSSLWGRVTPEIKSVAIEPRQPRAGKAVKVRAEIFNDPRETDIARTTSADLFYSADDGQNWQRIDMRRDKRQERIWSARIPGQKSGTRVRFYLQARDNFDNITSEIPFTNHSFPPDSTKMLLISDDSDDPEELVPADIDLLKTYVGYDDEHLYITQSVEGNLERGGRQNPFAPYLYFIVVINPDDANVYDFTDAPTLAYIPLASTYGLPSYGLLKLDRILRDPRSALLQNAVPAFIIDKEKGSHEMYFKLRRDSLGNNPSSAIKLVSLTMAITDLRRPGLIPWEASHFGLLYMRSHEFQVK